MATKIRMYNAEVEQLSQFVINLKLKGGASRMRTRFTKLLQERLELIRSEHQEMIKQHCDLDDEGNPKTIQKDEKEVYDIKDMESFNKDYTELMVEVFTVEINESNQQMIDTVAEALLGFDEELSGQDALVFDRFCEILDGVEDSISE